MAFNNFATKGTPRIGVPAAPAYQYVEYPKWVQTGEGVRIVVQNAAEERAATCAIASKDEPPNGLSAPSDELASDLPETPMPRRRGRPLKNVLVE